MRIEIVVFDGFDELDVFGPFEVLSMAGFDVELVAVERPGPVTSMRGVQLRIPGVLGEADGVIVPGGGWLNRAVAGAWAQARHGVLPARLAALAPSARWMASVCTGGLLLAAAGLLAGRRATTNRNAYEELRAYDVTVVDERVVDDGDRITAGALTAGLDLGLWITVRELGAATANRVAATIEYPAPTPERLSRSSG
ncbi:DJ-1/PfpI family protein [Micromonospora sp. CPCC 206061]|uniref:DJ-1/PfpI family protein n=1 Tax=Micromonospora sp. CPCC 206061 TaxID=3122410 RepID=UPI002FF1867E